MNDQTFLISYMYAATLTVDFVLLRQSALLGPWRTVLVRLVAVAVLLSPLVFTFGYAGLLALAAAAVPWFAITYRGPGSPARPARSGAWSPAVALLLVGEQAVAFGAVLVGWLAVRDAYLSGWIADNILAPHPGLTDELVHWGRIGFVLWALVVLNSAAGSRLVSMLLPPEVDEAGPEPAAAPPRPGYSLKLGPFSGRVVPDPVRPVHEPDSVGATIGVIERLLVVVLILGRAEVAIGLVVAAKTLARFKQLDERHFAERYLVGTLTSITIAVATALVARYALLGS